MTAVVLRANKAVELLIIHLRKPVLELTVLSFKPLSEAISDFINLRVCQLDGLCIRNLDVVTVIIRTVRLHDFRCRVVQGMTQQGYTVITAILTPDAELAPYLRVLLCATGIELVYLRRIHNVNLRVIEVCHEGGIDIGGNPTLTEVEVQVFKGNRCRHGILQGIQRLHRPVIYLTTVSLYQPFDVLHLFHDVSGNELVAYLVVT